MELSAVITIELCRFLASSDVMRWSFAPFYARLNMNEMQIYPQYIDWQKVICCWISTCWLFKNDEEEKIRLFGYSILIASKENLQKKRKGNENLFKILHLFVCFFFSFSFTY